MIRVMNQIDPTMAATFFFDAVDVAANRSGHLSPAQAERFRVAARVSRAHVPKVMAIVVVAVVVSFVVAANGAGVDAAQLALVGGLLLLALAVITLLVRRNYAMADQLDQPYHEVKQAESRPTTHWNTTSDIRSLVVGGVRFPMMWDDLELFREDTVYRVYYTQLGKRPQMLSVEVVG